MNIDINDIKLDNAPTIVGTIQQLIKLRRFIVEQIPQEDPRTIDTLLQIAVAPLNIAVSSTTKPTYIPLDPTSLKPVVTK